VTTYYVVFNAAYDPEEIDADDFEIRGEWVGFIKESSSAKQIIRVIRSGLVDQIIRQD